MTDTVDKLLGLADRFASRHADACEARAAGLHGPWDDDARQAKAELEAALCEAQDWGELVVAIHDLASNFENALYAFGDDKEARKRAEGDIAHAMKIAAKHNQNGSGCKTPNP